MAETALVTGWTDRHVVHGPKSCYCYTPCINDIKIMPMLDLHVNQFVLVENRLDPAKTHYVYGPCLLRMNDPFEIFGPIQNALRLDQNDYIFVEDRTGVRRAIHGPCIYKPQWGEDWSKKPMEAVIVPINHYIIVKDTSSTDSPVRHLRGPVKFYPGPYDEIQRDGDTLKQCIEVTDNSAVHIKRVDGSITMIDMPQYYMPAVGEVLTQRVQRITLQVNQYLIIRNTSISAPHPLRVVRGPIKFFLGPFDAIEGSAAPHEAVSITGTKAAWLRNSDGVITLIDRPQFLIPEIGESIERLVDKTILQQSEFAIIIAPDGRNILRMGNVPEQRAFFLPPLHTFLPFRIRASAGAVETTVDRFTTLPTYISHAFVVCTSDNVRVRLDLRISFTIFDPSMYAAKPVDFDSQIRYWIQNEMLDSYAKVAFRDFLKTYADTAISATSRAHERFGEFGLNVLDVQVISFSCEDKETEALVQTTIKTNVSKQNELREVEANVEIMARKKDVEIHRKDIEFALQEKDNQMAIGNNDLKVTLRLKELDVEIQEETRRSELLRIRRQNAVMESEFEGHAAGASVSGFMGALPESLSPQDKMAVWRRIQDLKQQSELLTHAAPVQIVPAGTEMKCVQVSIDDGAKQLLERLPTSMPALMGYNVPTAATMPFVTQVQHSV